MLRFLMFVTQLSFAQEVVFKRDTLVKDTLVSGVVIESSSDLSAYLKKNRRAACYKPKKNRYSTKKHVMLKADSQKRHTEMNTNKDAWCKRYPKVLGYKIQVFYTKDRAKSIAFQNTFRRKFPYIAPEMVYARPDFKVLVGDYLTRKSAYRDLRKIKDKYPGSFLVQWRVWCRKAK